MTAPDDRRGSERALVERCIAGEEDAWREIVSAYGPGAKLKIVQVYLHRTGRPPGPQEQHEILQDLFVRLAKNGAASLRRFQWRCALATYLSAVAGTCALERIRQDARARGRDERRVELEAAGEELTAEERRPIERLEASELRRRLSVALRALPPRERLAIRMYFWEGMPPAQVANALRTTPGYVWVILRRSLRALREGMDDGGER